MAAVTKRPVHRMFAAAPSYGFRFCNLDFHWRESRAFVGTITKRLGFGVAAGTPPVSTWFHLQHEW